ncbi:hypothetical protein P7H20_19200 [Paenibacillus larvae]|nr:hypothetical protein [Paenibacillus larvae]MDT2276528.1 hypothetical protein [Paenibacillus larvae]
MSRRTGWPAYQGKRQYPDKLATGTVRRSIPMLVGILGLFKAGGAYAD